MHSKRGGEEGCLLAPSSTCRISASCSAIPAEESILSASSSTTVRVEAVFFKGFFRVSFGVDCELLLRLELWQGSELWRRGGIES